MNLWNTWHGLSHQHHGIFVDLLSCILLILGINVKSLVRNHTLFYYTYNLSLPFKCYVIGNPLPSVNWYLNGTLLLSNSHQLTIKEEEKESWKVLSTLFIISQNATSANTGSYWCEAKNHYGTVRKMAGTLIDKSSKLWQ